MINIAIMGHGVVGSGVAEILLQNSQHITDKAKNEINIKYILDLRDFDDLSYSNKFIKDFNIILEDSTVEIVVEVMGGIHPAYEYVKQCLTANKSVVTSNKELVAAKGDELLALAEENNVNFLFEASVGGGIPILRPMAQCLAANNLLEVTGILNGTTNFIMTKMFKESMSFDDALHLAQKLGYAERDPSADVDGHDACRKICILASLAFGKHIYPEQVFTEGISNITRTDVAYAASCGRVIKLIGHAKSDENGKIYASVYPALIRNEHPLAGVDDVFNAIMLVGDYIGEVMFYGRGAGKLPTASAVVADIIDCAKHLQTRKYLKWDSGNLAGVANIMDDETQLFVRAYSRDKAAALNEAEETFNGLQIVNRKNEKPDEFAFITPKNSEKALRRSLASLSKCEVESVIHLIN